MKSYPKQPKSDNIKVLEDWKKKCEAVKKYNNAIEAEKKKVAALKETVKKMKQK
ncbi:hypothetical protein [Runella limosa]|uniref:hypothetical protein n=1 Tax=Runella limosa TaxID=370978 RepID=UPI001B7FDE65|nr:hypothetical protein [Runella limosa]